MEHRQLRYFVAVAEELSFSRAAQRLNISQPPVSAQIKSLEDDLGVLLFERDSRKVALTKAGEVLLSRAKVILESLASASDATRRAARGEAGRLVIGFASSVPMNDRFTSAIQGFRQRYPAVDVDAVCMPTARQLSGLEAGEFDACLVRPAYWYRPPTSIALTALWEDPLELFFPSHHWLSHASDPVSIEGLSAEKFITVESDLGCGLYEQTVTMCMRSGFRPNIVQQVSTSNSVLSSVAAGSGIAILPGCRAKTLMGGIAHRAISDDHAHSSIFLATRRQERDQHTRNFMAFMMGDTQDLAA